MKFIKYFVVLLALVSMSARAQNWSYIYIQGDKKTPFYVKLEGEMLPRYSKNYYIIPQLTAGPVQIQVLFQQNEFPEQQFKVMVPENGHRGFLLTKKDQGFALYDIQQKFYLMPGDAGEDRLPEGSATNTPVASTPAANSEKAMLDQAFKSAGSNDPKFINDVVLENERRAAPANAPAAAPVTQPVAEPIKELPNEKTTEQPIATIETAVATPVQEPIAKEQPVGRDPETGAAAVEVEVEKTTKPVETPVAAPISPSSEANTQPTPPPAPVAERKTPVSTTVFVPVDEPSEREQKPKRQNNPDCPEAVTKTEFDRIVAGVREKDDDEDRLSYLNRMAKTSCFSTEQVYYLARELGPESMRYSFLKKVYGRVSDQYNFRQLEDYLFKTLEWKRHFRQIN